MFLASVLGVVSVGAASAVPSIEWLPPLTKHDEFAFKDGSTLPIKFRLLNNAGSFVMDPTAEVSVHDILFMDDFEDGVADGWAEGPGIWNVEGGSYVYSKVDENVVQHTYSLVNTLTVTDFIAEVKIKQLTTTQRDSGIQFWHQDSSNYYYANFDRDALGLWLFKGGGYVLVHSKGHSYDVTQWHTVKVVVQDWVFRMYVDGNLEWTETLSYWGSGMIGVHAHRDSYTQFDDVYVLGAADRASFALGTGIETPFEYNLFTDHFEDPVSTAWTPVSGTWSVEGGEYKQSQNLYIPGSRSVAGDVTWTDYTVLAKVRVVDGSWGRWGGILLRVADPGDSINAGTYYELYLQARATETSGRLQLVKTVAGVRTGIVNPDVGKFWDDGWWYVKGTVRSTDGGAQVLGKAWKDGTTEPDWQISWVDSSPISGGQIGLITYSQLVYFDDISVLGYLYQCNLHTKELGMAQGTYMVTVWLDGRSIQAGMHPFELTEPGKGKGKA